MGAGIQTTALGIMVANGEVETDVMIFADTGGEHPDTYRHIRSFNAWLKERGREIVTVKAKDGPLYDYVWNKSAVIPIRVGAANQPDVGLGRRQCTRQWKITPVIEYARALTDERPIIMQLGISIDETHRMKDSPDKDVIREWPLIDLRMTREDCRRVILDAGMDEPRKSACYFCPLLGAEHFRTLAANEPELFEKAAALEDRMNEREAAKGKGKQVFIASRRGRPLREMASGQISLMDMLEPAEGDECEGTCFV